MKVNWNATLTESLRKIGEARVRLSYANAQNQPPFTKYITVFEDFEPEIIGFLDRTNVLKRFLGSFADYKETVEGKVVAKELYQRRLNPLPQASCYELNEQELNELCLKIASNEMPKLKADRSGDDPTLVPLQSSMMNHADRPYGV